jgi:uncharacterized protein with FMN-binding domain
MSTHTKTSLLLRLSPPAIVPLALIAAGCGGHGKPKPTTRPAKVSGAPTAPAAAGLKSGTFTGQDIPTQFGDVQVQIIVKGGKITDLGGVRLPFDRPRSLFISQQAAPILRSEVLAAQSARIDLLSGATFTSDAWATSVQSAIDQAR